MEKIVDKAVTYAVNIANDNSHGYDQAHRWGKPDYDCSALVIDAYEKAGVAVKEAGASYTGDMLKSFIKAGFNNATAGVNRVTGEGLKPGDVLLKPEAHAAMYIGDGKLVQASINEKGTTRGGKPGDQTGKEIAVRSYYNFPWSYVLRYPEAPSPAPSKTKVTYSAHIKNGKWTPEVSTTNQYAGTPTGKAIDCFMIKADAGKITYKVHTYKNKKWLPPVTGYKTTDPSNGYAGNMKEDIDAIAIKATGIVGTLKYRVHVLGGGWLPWVTGYKTTDASNGYAGNIGQRIDAIQINIK